MKKAIAVTSLLALGLFACGSESGGDSKVAPDASVEADTGVVADAGTQADMGAENIDPGRLGWIRGDVANGPVVRIESAGGTVWALGAGTIHEFGADAVQTHEVPELTIPIDLAVSGTSVAAVGLDSDGVGWLVQRDGSDWSTTQLPGAACPGGAPCADSEALEPGGIDIDPDGVIRVAARGGFFELQSGEFVPNTFTGAEEVRFQTLEFSNDIAWLFGDTSSIYRDGSGSWRALPQPASTAGDGFDQTFAFWANDGLLLRYEDRNPIVRRVETTDAFAAVHAISQTQAVFAGAAGALVVATVPADGGSLEDLQALVTADLSVDSDGADFTAVHVVTEDEVWLGTAGGSIYRYGLGGPAGFEEVDGDAVDFDAVTNPDPDPDPEPEPDPTYLRFVAFGLGTIVCDGTTAVTPTLGEYEVVSDGYETTAPVTQTFDQEVAAAGRCRGLGLGEFDVRLSEGDLKTAVVGTNISFSAPVLTDDPTPPTAGSARVRIWGHDRVGTGDLTAVEYCIDGSPLMGGSKPNTGFVEYSVGQLDVVVRIADGSCTGSIRDTFSVTLAEGETRSLFLGPGDDLGPMRELDDVFVINCLDALDGEPTTPSNCDSFYAQPQPQ